MADFMNEMPRGEQRERADSGWERSVLEKMALALVIERRRARRWSVFFRLLVVLYVAGMTAIWLGLWRPWAMSADTETGDGGPHTALVRIDGVIDYDGENSARRVNAALRRAFEDPRTAGVVLEINSPGGSPVQSALVFEEIRRLREAHPATELHVVVGEVCASGGYYIAAAADKIHVSQASLVGSIGVLVDGFGFVGAMHKLGIERRLFAAGQNKGFMDSFSPVAQRERDHLQGLLNQIHEQFIAAVKLGRGERLADDPSLFSGLIWTGQQAIGLGLADSGLGSARAVARDIFKADRLVDFSTSDSLLERVARRFGITFGAALGSGVREGAFAMQWR